MKNSFAILFIFISAIVFSGCSSVSGKNASHSKKVNVSNEIKYSNKGTRSEGRSGYLVINGTVIPDCFNTVVAGNSVYIFKTKSTVWGDDGYFPSLNEMPDTIYPVSSKKIDDGDIAHGWCEITHHYSNIPGNWIFVKWSNGSAALSPDKIDILVKVKSLKTIQRNTMFTNKKTINKSE